jgi:ketosteroid isomerase-like protein
MGEVAEVVRLAFERLNDRDIDGFAALCSPRIEWHEVPEIPGARTYRGPDEVAEAMDDLIAVSKSVRFVNWEIQERGDAGLMDMSVDMEGSSGMNLGWRAWAVWRVRERLIAYYAGYSDRAEAIADFEPAANQDR